MSPLLYRLSYRARIGAPADRTHPTGRDASSRHGEVRSGCRMVPLASFLGQTPSSVGQTIALVITFLGIGVLANLVIFYIVGQVLAERRQNQEHRPGEE
jgi:hypothetical protein